VSAALTAHYRSFELPWSVQPEQQRRFRRIWMACLLVVVVLGMIVPWLPTPDRALDVPPPVPPRFAKLVIERATPPPPPPPVVETLPEEAPVVPRERPEQREVPTPAPDIDRTQQARKKAAQAGLLPFVDQLADLRDKFEVTPDQLRATATQSATTTGAPRAERALVTSKAGVTSGGINTAAVSAGMGYGEGSLEGHGTTQMQVPFGGSGGGSAVRSDGVADGVSRSGSGKRPSRTQEEIELVFDRNKAAIYALYNRALRDNPALKGKVVMQLTIAPSGEITDIRIVSSELGDPELERKLVARVKMFRFEDKDVEAITTTKPIEFFPA
jgi:periplasmic protein TonB